MKNIILIGAPRCGKTTIANYLSENYNYEVIRGDCINVALEDFYKKELNDGKKTFVMGRALTDEMLAEVIVTIYKQLKIDLFQTNRGIVIDTADLDINSAIKYFGDEFNIYCLGMPDIENKDIYTDSSFKENYGWQLEDVEVFEETIEAKGKLSLWEYDI